MKSWEYIIQTKKENIDFINKIVEAYDGLGNVRTLDNKKGLIKIITNSFHHQFIDKLGDGLTAIAKSNDGVVEAIQMEGHKFLYGIKWHPEMMIARKNEQMKEIFKKFIEASSY